MGAMPYLAPLLPERKKRVIDSVDGPEIDETEGETGADAESSTAPAKRARTDEIEGKGDESESAAFETAAFRVLFLQGLPGEANETMLALLFEQYPGFREVRIVPGRPGIAFVEYEAAGQAAVARDVLHGFKLTPTHCMSVSFAKSGDEQ